MRLRRICPIDTGAYANNKVSCMACYLLDACMNDILASHQHPCQTFLLYASVDIMIAIIIIIIAIIAITTSIIDIIIDLKQLKLKNNTSKCNITFLIANLHLILINLNSFKLFIYFRFRHLNLNHFHY